MIALRADRSPSARMPAFAVIAASFVASRLIIYAVGVIGAVGFVDHHTLTTQSLEALNPQSVWHKWDALWYERIAVDRTEGDAANLKSRATAAFMPLYPWVVRAVMQVLPRADFFWTGVLVSNAASLIALILLVRHADERGADARLVLVLMLTSAGSFYLSIPYTEGLYLLLTALAFRLTSRDRHPAAGLVCGLAAVTRIQGLATLAIPAGDLLVRAWRGSRPFTRAAATVAGFALPLAIYLFINWRLFGSPFAFVTTQAMWDNPSPYPLQAVVGLVVYPRRLSALLHGAFWFMFVGLLVRYARSLPFGETAFCAGVLLVSSSTESFYGTYRYALPLLPIYMGLSRDEPWLRTAFIWANLVLGAIWIVAFVTSNRLAV
jgi:Gpi18-like mannosyltransferase